MKNKNKILPKIVSIVLVLTLVSSMLVSTVFAKYVVTDALSDLTTRPAAFSFDVNFSDVRNLNSNFSVDGEPGNPLGHSEFAKYYYFKVQTVKSEVALSVNFKIEFNGKLAQKIRVARNDKYADGIFFDYELEMLDPSTDKYVTIVKPYTAYKKDGYLLSEDTITTVSTSNLTTPLVATINTISEPNKNLDGTTDSSKSAQFRLKVVVYNNTDMPTSGNTTDYFYSTDCFTVKVSAENVAMSYN